MNCLLCKGEVNPPEYDEPETILVQWYRKPNPKHNGKLTHKYFWDGKPVCECCEKELRKHRKPLPPKKSETELAHDRSFAKWMKSRVGKSQYVKLDFDSNNIHPGSPEHRQQKKIATVIHKGILTVTE